MGLELLAVNQEAGIVEMAFNATDKLCNKWGGIQGGNVAAMLDDAMAFAIGLNLDWGQISPTLEIKVSMLAPARPGRILAVGRVLRRGRSVGFVEGELYDAEGRCWRRIVDSEFCDAEKTRILIGQTAIGKLAQVWNAIIERG